MATLVFILLIVELMDHIEDVDSRRELDTPTEVNLVKLIESDNAREAEAALVALPAEFLRHAFGSFDEHVRLKKMVR
jgi:hypothetical protein